MGARPIVADEAALRDDGRARGTAPERHDAIRAEFRLALRVAGRRHPLIEGCERIDAEGTLPVGYGVVVGVVHVEGDIAGAFGKIASPDERGIVAGAIALAGDVPLRVDAEALEILLHDEVDDAGDRVRSIDRRCPTREDLDPLDQGRRDEVEVSLRSPEGAPRHHALAVDERQRARRTQSSQVDVGDTTGAAWIGGLGEGEIPLDRRQAIEQGVYALRALGLELLVAHHLQGSRSRERRLANARAGDYDALQHGWTLAAGGRGRGRRRHRLIGGSSGCGGAYGRGVCAAGRRGRPGRHDRRGKRERRQHSE